MATKTIDGEKSGAVKAEDAAKSGGKRRPMTGEAVRVLERMNKDLLVRVKQLESSPGAGTEEYESEGEGNEASGPAAGSSSIVATVKDLHGEIDAAYVLKRALEADLIATRTKLSEKETASAQLEARASLLEIKAALGDQLREDISFVEEEQNKTVRRLTEVTSELERVTEERDSLAGHKTNNEARIKELQTERFSFEAQVISLKDRLAEMVSLFTEKRASS